MRKNFITKLDSYFITKCDSFITKCDNYYKIRRFYYKNATVITKCNVYYKLWQYNDLPNAKYEVGNEIIYNIELLKSNVCNYSDAYILVKGNITVIAAPATQGTFKNCTPFIKCITKIDGTTIDDVEDLDLVMPMYNVIEYSSNYSKTTGSLWFNWKDEATDFNNNIENTDDFKSFKNKAKLLGNTDDDRAIGILKNAIIVVPLKKLSNFGDHSKYHCLIAKSN